MNVVLTCLRSVVSDGSVDRLCRLVHAAFSLQLTTETVSYYGNTLIKFRILLFKGHRWHEWLNHGLFNSQRLLGYRLFTLEIHIGDEYLDKIIHSYQQQLMRTSETFALANLIESICRLPFVLESFGQRSNSPKP